MAEEADREAAVITSAGGFVPSGAGKTSSLVDILGTNPAGLPFEAGREGLNLPSSANSAQGVDRLSLLLAATGSSANPSDASAAEGNALEKKAAGDNSLQTENPSAAKKSMETDAAGASFTAPGHWNWMEVFEFPFRKGRQNHPYVRYVRNNGGETPGRGNRLFEPWRDEDGMSVHDWVADPRPLTLGGSCDTDLWLPTADTPDLTAVEKAMVGRWLTFRRSWNWPEL